MNTPQILTVIIYNVLKTILSSFKKILCFILYHYRKHIFRNIRIPLCITLIFGLNGTYMEVSTLAASWKIPVPRKQAINTLMKADIVSILLFFRNLKLRRNKLDILFSCSFRCFVGINDFSAYKSIR